MPTSFDDFWRIYPKKVARDEALRAFAKAIEIAPPQEIIRGAMRYATERTGQDPHFTKHPTTWLSKACWTDPALAPHETPRHARQARCHFNGSVVERIHTDDDFNEVLTRIQTQRRGRE